MSPRDTRRQARTRRNGTARAAPSHGRSAACIRCAGSPRPSWSIRPGQGPHRDPGWIRRSVPAADRPSLYRERSQLALRCRYRSAVLHQRCRRDVDSGGLDGAGARHATPSHAGNVAPGTRGPGRCRTTGCGRSSRGQDAAPAGTSQQHGGQARKEPFPCSRLPAVAAVVRRTELPPPRRRGAGRSHAWSGAWPGTAICGPHRTVFHRGLVPVPTTNRAVSPAVMAWSRSADAWPLPHGHAQCPPTADRRRLPQALDGLAHPHRSRRCVAVRLGARVGGWVLLAAGRHADPPDLAGGGRLHWAPPRADHIWPTPSFGCPCCHRQGQVLD